MSAIQTQQSSTTGTFEPRIVAFVCKWCTYAGADLAGTSRMVYPPNVRTIMLPCTGRIDVSFVLRAFLQGADGVIVSGCHPGDCHYTAGNYRARRRWTLFRDLLDILGFDLRRFDLAWISAAEGAKWVKTIQSFTDKIKAMGAYDAMRKVAEDRAPAIAPLASAVAPAGENHKQPAKPADPKLITAVTDALSANQVKAVIGWFTSGTLSAARPGWITSADAAKEMVAPGDTGNLARIFKKPQFRTISPVGLVARSSEVLALNVLMQEAQLDPKQVVIFLIESDGRFIGTMDADAASAHVTQNLPVDRPVGFSDKTMKLVDELMAKSPDERFKFWADQSARCLKCNACRGSCPMCNCEQCFADKNQPQWFPTAADGPGNLAWHIMRTFHMAGRCVGCGACQDACPAGIPLNALSAAMARSAVVHFNHRAGVDPKAVPLQSDYRPDDKESFIL